MKDQEVICKVIDVINRVEVLYSTSKKSDSITIEFDWENQLYKIRDFLQDYIRDRFVEMSYNGHSETDLSESTKEKLRQALNGTEEKRAAVEQGMCDLQMEAH